MDASDLEKRLDELVAKLTDRNKQVQQAKDKGGTSWVVALVIALISLAGIGVAMWLSYRRSRELAKAKTELEQQRVAQAQKKYEAERETLLGKRNELMNEVAEKEKDVAKLEEELKEAEERHKERQKQLEALNAWKEINEA